MGIKVIYSHNAKQDLKEIYDYIRKDSFKYAQREIRLIRTAINRLTSNSLLGKRFEKFDDEVTREMIFKNYRIIYDIIKDDLILILTIRHHARLITNNPAFGDKE